MTSRAMPSPRTLSTEPDILQGLNGEQKKAVRYGEGPLLILAGAGTGKTTVIARRVAHLIAAKKALPREILALTFTDKAANQMEERIDQLVPYGYVDVWVSTFHAFGDRILREFSVELGVTPSYRLLTRPEQIIFLANHLFELPMKIYRPLGNPTKYLEAIASLISRTKDEDVLPVDYLEFARGLQARAEANPSDEELKEIALRQKELAEIYKVYEEIKGREGFLDFGDQVTLLLRSLRKNKIVLRKLQERFKYILVDEFQDTNYAQFELVKLLAARHRNLTVVGDDDQSIFRFRGAAISNILMFKDEYKGAESVVLTQNYRSPQLILDSAYRLIQHNNPDRLEVKLKVDKHLRSQGGVGVAPRHVHCDTISTEADWVAQQIAERVASGGSYKDFAILVRANREADPFIRALNLKGIPFWFSGGQGLYQRDEVRLLIHFIRAIARTDESNSVYFLASSEIFQLDPLFLQKASTLADRAHRPLIDFLENGDRKVQEFVSEIHRFVRLSVELPAGVLLYRFLKETGYLERLTHAGTLEAEDKLKSIARFFEKVRGFEAVALENRIRPLADFVDALMEAGDDPTENDWEDREAVQILTIHKAKGLEFPVVFMVGLVDGKFPTRRRSEAIELPDELVKEILPLGDYHLEEERRLFYVGMTRAQKELFLTSAADYGGRRERKVSPFVLEALDLPKRDIPMVQKSAAEALELFAQSPQVQLFPEKPLPEEAPLELSFSQFEAYHTCPLKYYWRYKIRIPQPAHHRFVVGQALHAAAQVFNNAKRQGKIISLRELLRAFEEVWRSEGFIHRAHEDQRLAECKKALKKFYEYEKKSPIRPFLVEEPFKIRVENVWLSGRWDRVDKVKGKGVVIDYKSSEVTQQKDADRKAKESEQLTVYALAYLEKYGQLPDHVELRFFGSGLIGEAERDEKDLSEIREAIVTVGEGIRSRNYTADPNPFKCGQCEFADICPASAK